MPFKPKILVVEDDTTMLRLLGEVLGQMGAEPHCVASSVHAAELIEKEKYDGIFLDWRMPEIDGMELARRVRASQSNGHVPLVMLTGVADSQGLKKSFEAGINFYLQKPVSVSQLRNLLNASRGMMLAERRGYQRAPVAVPMRCRWDNQAVTGCSINVSASGVLLEIAPAPPVGTRVQIDFELPGQPKPYKLSGTAVRVAVSRGVAVKFETDPDTHRRLMEFVEKSLERAGGPLPVLTPTY